MKQLNYEKMSWEQMADIVLSIWNEMKRRNPLGVNLYRKAFQEVVGILYEVREAEAEHPTCEAGPGVGMRRKRQA